MMEYRILFNRIMIIYAGLAYKVTFNFIKKCLKFNVFTSKTVFIFLRNIIIINIINGLLV